MKVEEILRGFPDLDHFDDSQIQNLVGLGVVRHREAGARVLREGDPPVQLFLVLKGTFRIEHSTQFGPLTLAHVLPGDLLGDMGYVEGKNHAADAVAESDAHLLSFDSEELGYRSEQDAAFATALLWVIWKSLSSKLRNANEQMAGFFTGEQSAPPLELPIPAPRQERDFRIDLATKRSLFQEQRLSSLEINLLASLSKERRYESGEVIFHEGEPADEMYVVLGGTVLINKFIPGAGDEALAFLERGDYFGEMALIDDLPRSAGARAHEDGVTVLAIPRSVVDGLLDIDKVSSLRLLRLLCSMVAKRLRDSNGKLLGWYLLSAGQRA